MVLVPHPPVLLLMVLAVEVVLVLLLIRRYNFVKSFKSLLALKNKDI